LPKRHRDRAVRSTRSGTGIAFREPFVGSEFLSCCSPCSAQGLNATDDQDEQGGMKFSTAHHLMSYCRPLTNIPDPPRIDPHSPHQWLQLR
jgi:hypothetical protein